MAHTTTARSTYSLVKYSRSYPSENISNADWQHFTNPVLRLVLDVTRSDKSEARSVRLKVIWTLQNGGIITVNDNSEIVLASLGYNFRFYLLPLNYNILRLGRHRSFGFLVSTSRNTDECSAEGSV